MDAHKHGGPTAVDAGTHSAAGWVTAPDLRDRAKGGRFAHTMSATVIDMGAVRGRRAHGILAAGLVLGAVGPGAAWLVTQPRPPFPFGTPILLVAAAVVGFVSPRRRGGLVGLAAIAFVVYGLVASDRIGELGLTRGAALGVARWAQASGLLVAAVSAVVVLIGQPWVGGVDEPRPSDLIARRESRARAGQIGGLLVLSAIGAELLAAYSDSTGRPAELLFAVVFFAALYGAPALLIREVARRNGWGWTSIIMIAGALGLIQAALIDQSLFSLDYQDIDGWSRSLKGTFVEPLGFSATNALNFIPGHVIFSFCAPIAVAEAWRPQTAHAPWLGWRGTAVAALAYLVAAVVILTDPGSHSASTAQLVASIAVAGLCVGAALLVGRRRPHHRPTTRSAPPLWATVTGSMLVMTAATLGPETWTGAASTMTAFAAGGIALVRVSQNPGWGVRHAAAVATGALLTRGTLAFLYYPLMGDTPASRKYTHNVVMLAIVAVAGWFAMRTPKSTAAEPTDHRPQVPG